MKSKILFLALVASLLLAPQANAQNKATAKALVWIATTVVGLFGSKAAENADLARSDYEYQKSLIERMRNQGVDPVDGAIFSLYFSLNGDASSVYWADIVGKPDIYAVVDIEGQGTFLIPKIFNEYSGQPTLETVIAKNAKPGARVVVNIYDDDSFSDTVWNEILQSSVNYQIDANVGSVKSGHYPNLVFNKSVGVSLQANGKIRLLDRNLVIDAPDFITGAEFKIPYTTDGCWHAGGELRDPKNNIVGRMEFAQVWRADPAVFKRMNDDANKAHARFVFWCSIGGVALLVGIGILISRFTKPA